MTTTVRRGPLGIIVATMVAEAGTIDRATLRDAVGRYERYAAADREQAGKPPSNQGIARKVRIVLHSLEGTGWLRRAGDNVVATDPVALREWAEGKRDARVPGKEDR